MAGREVREYTNLTDPKGNSSFFLQLIASFFLSFVVVRFWWILNWWIDDCLWQSLADKKWGKGKDKIDDEDITFQRMVAKVRAFFYLLFFFFLFSFFLLFSLASIVGWMDLNTLKLSSISIIYMTTANSVSSLILISSIIFVFSDSTLHNC